MHCTRVCLIVQPLAWQVGDVIGITDLQSGSFICGEDVINSALFLDCPDVQLNPEQSPHNLQYAQFVVTPKFQYSTHRQIDHFLSQIRTEPEAAVPSDGTASVQSKLTRLVELLEKLPPTDRLVSEIQRLYNAYENEEKTNEMEFNRSLGHPVAYGTVIQLKHLRSGKFVSQSRTRAKMDAQAMALSLLQGGNKGSWLRIESADRNRADGEHVVIGDQVHFSAAKFPGTYLTVFEPEEKYAEELFPVPRGSITSVDSAELARFGILHDHAIPPSSPSMSGSFKGKKDNALKTRGSDVPPLRAADGGRQRLEVNASSQAYDLQIQLVRSCESNTLWLQQGDQGETETANLSANGMIYGTDGITIKQGHDRLLYADPARETVWWLVRERREGGRERGKND